MDSITIFRDLCALGRAIVQKCALCCVSFEATARKLDSDKFRIQNGIDFNFQKLEGIRWNDIVKNALNTEYGEIITLQYNDKSRYQLKAVDVFHYICVFSKFAEEEGMKKGEINGLVLMKYEKEKEGEIIAEIEIPKNVGEVTRACGKDMIRPQLSYVHIEKSAQEGKGYIVGTNGNVLNVMAIKLHLYADGFSEINLPAEFVNASKGEKVWVTKKKDGRIFAECGTKQFFDENLRYPNWKSVFHSINKGDAIRLDVDAVRKHLKKAFVKVYGQECGIIRAEKGESTIHLDNHGNIKDIPAANVVHDIELYIPHDRFSKILGKMEYLYFYRNLVYAFGGKSCSLFTSTECANNMAEGEDNILDMILDGIKVDENKKEEHEAVIIEDVEAENAIHPDETVESSNGECTKENAPESQACEMEGNNAENNNNTAELLEISKDRIKRMNYELLNGNYRIPLLFIHPHSVTHECHLNESGRQMPGGFKRYHYRRIKAKSGAARIIPSIPFGGCNTWNNGNFAEAANKAVFWPCGTNIRRANYTAKFGAYSRKLGTCDITPNNRGPTT